MRATTSRWWHGILGAIPVILVALAMLGLWQGIVMWMKIPPIVLPSPVTVCKAAWEERSALGAGLLVTSISSLGSLGLATLVGSLLAILFSQSKLLRAVLYPYVIFLQTVPIVAIAPLMILWFGYRPITVLLIGCIISVFPILSNVTAGLLSVSQNHRDLFQLYGAGRWTLLWKLRIPNAVGHLALGLRISCGLSVIGAIMGEFFVGSGTQYSGLGALMTRWLARQATAPMISAVVLAALLGLTMFALVNLVTATLLKRWVPAASSP